jgi:hypothetical protein
MVDPRGGPFAIKSLIAFKHTFFNPKKELL